MKKNLISLVAFLCCITMASVAQIPNAGFENWTAGDPDGWVTSNVFQVGLIPITQTNDKHTGSSALRGEVVNFMGSPMGPVIQSGPGGTGFPISEQYRSFELYYKFTSIGGDKFSVNVGLEKAGVPIAQGAVAIPTTIGGYTFLSVPLNYFNTEVPDLAIIQISITGPVTGNDYHIGSVMYVDDFLFSFSTGIESNPAPNLTRKCYPNPSTDMIHIPLDENISGEVVVNIVDTKGNVVNKFKSNPQQHGINSISFSVKDLLPGLYFYSVDGTTRQYSGKFAVGK